MDNVLPLYSDVRLIDAHSFVWILHGEPFEEWVTNLKDDSTIEKRMEQYLLEYKEGNGKCHVTHSSVFNRSQEVVKIVKKERTVFASYANNRRHFSIKKGSRTWKYIILNGYQEAGRTVPIMQLLFVRIVIRKCMWLMMRKTLKSL